MQIAQQLSFDRTYPVRVVQTNLYQIVILGNAKAHGGRMTVFEQQNEYLNEKENEHDMSCPV